MYMRFSNLKVERFSVESERFLSPFLPPLDSIIQSPRNVRSSKDEETSIVVTNTVHLNQKLCLDAPRPLGLAIPTSSGEGINFVNEDDSWLVFSRHLEKLPYEP